MIDGNNVKVILVGDTGVGKTSIFNRYCYNSFSPSFVTTLGVDYCNIDYKSKLWDHLGNTKIHIWDTAGQERYNSIVSTYYRNADIVIIVFDLTSFRSFSGIPDWIANIEKLVDNPNIIVVGNKLDKQKNHTVNKEDIESFISTYNLPYVETSAQNSIGIDVLFDKAMDMALSGKQHITKPSGRFGDNVDKIILVEKPGFYDKYCQCELIYF